jgi:hypothetical protein
MTYALAHRARPAPQRWGSLGWGANEDPNTGVGSLRRRRILQQTKYQPLLITSSFTVTADFTTDSDKVSAAADKRVEEGFITALETCELYFMFYTLHVCIHCLIIWRTVRHCLFIIT